MMIDAREFAFQQTQKVANAMALVNDIANGSANLDEFSGAEQAALAEELAQAAGIAEACAALAEQNLEDGEVIATYDGFAEAFLRYARVCADLSDEYCDDLKADRYLESLSRYVVAYLDHYDVSPLTVFESARRGDTRGVCSTRLH